MATQQRLTDVNKRTLLVRADVRVAGEIVDHELLGSPLLRLRSVQFMVRPGISANRVPLGADMAYHSAPRIEWYLTEGQPEGVDISTFQAGHGRWW